jgi:hypothetical protein
MTVTWPDDTVIAAKLFSVLLDKEKQTKDFQIVLPVTFKAALQEKTIEILAKREEEKGASSPAPAKPAAAGKGKHQ